jgi:fructan beta-fructosidase
MNNQIDLYDEPYRPQFHFSARTGWLNGPNGLVYFEGEYHLFFQHNRDCINWGNIHWGHAVSPDLLHWRELPIALKPDHLGAIFSGSAVVDWTNSANLQTEDKPALVAIYTSAGGESPTSQGQPYTQSIAYSNDLGRSWDKFVANPVLSHVVGQNRDPKVIRYPQNSSWIMSLYLDGEYYAIFSSKDLKHWSRNQTVQLPGASECPDLFPLTLKSEDKQYWTFMGANGLYLIGEFDGQHFNKMEGPYRVDYGANFYAVQTFSDIPEEDGRRIQIAWMAGGSYPGMPFNQQMGIPTELTLHRTESGLRVFRNPICEIQILRRKSYSWSNLILPNDAGVISVIRGDLFEIRVEIAADSDGFFSIKIRGTEITYSFAEQNVTCLGKSAPLPAVAGIIKLHILVDRTSIEIFGNEGEISMSFCFCPEDQDQSFALSSECTSITLHHLDIYELASSMHETAR